MGRPIWILFCLLLVTGYMAATAGAGRDIPADRRWTRSSNSRGSIPTKRNRSWESVSTQPGVCSSAVAKDCSSTSPTAKAASHNRQLVLRFPNHTWIYDIAIRGNDLYVKNRIDRQRDLPDPTTA